MKLNIRLTCISFFLCSIISTQLHSMYFESYELVTLEDPIEITYSKTSMRKYNRMKYAIMTSPLTIPTALMACLFQFKCPVEKIKPFVFSSFACALIVMPFAFLDLLESMPENKMRKALTALRACAKEIEKNNLNILFSQPLEQASQLLYQQSGGRSISVLTGLRYKLPILVKLFDEVLNKIPSTTTDQDLLTLKADAQLNKEYLIKWIDIVGRSLEYMRSPAFMQSV